MRQCTVTDRVEPLAASKRRFTAEGYLVAPGVLARAGNVQSYTRAELGLDGDPAALVKLFRPREEVLSPETIKSFDRQTFTINHPPGGVNAGNWGEHAVGDVHDVKPDGDTVAGTLIVRDQAAIEAILGGKSQLSNGYSFDLDMTPGVAADGQSFQGCQRRIRGNHTAAVDSARGGPGCRVSDEDIVDEADGLQSLRQWNSEQLLAAEAADGEPLSGRALWLSRIAAGGPQKAGTKKKVPPPGLVGRELWLWRAQNAALPGTEEENSDDDRSFNAAMAGRWRQP